MNPQFAVGIQEHCKWFKSTIQPLKLLKVFSCIVLQVLFFNTSFAQFSNASYNIISPEQEQNVIATLKKSSRTFQLVENKGQEGLPDNVVAYFSTFSQTVFIEKNKLRIVVYDPAKSNDQQPSFFPEDKTANFDPVTYRYNSFSIEFKGSKGWSGFEKGKPFETKRNFIYSNPNQKSITNVTSYDEITLKNIYEGIDLRLYSQANGQLEFDWIVWPEADPDHIKMKFRGQKNLLIDPNGKLVVELPMGKFQMHLPESYYATPDGKQRTDFKFKLASKNVVAFRAVQKQKSSYPLIIDPELLWGTFFDGGSSTFDEYLYGIEYNYSNELIYCAGVANKQVSTVYAAALAAGYNGTFTSGQDALVYALTKDGQTIQYITYLGGSGDDVATGVSIGGSNIFVCGHTSSTDLPVTNGSGSTTAAFDNSLGGSEDGFVAVFSTALDQLYYCSYLGGSSEDEALTIRATSSNSFYVSLHSYGSLPVSSPNYLVSYADNSFGGTEEAWIGEFSSFNSLSFGTYIGGTDVDVINDFQLLSNGDVVFVGTTNQITEVNGTVSSSSSGSDVLFGHLVVPVSGSVSFQVLEKLGGSGFDYGYGIYSLGDSVSILVGKTKSSSFPSGSGSVFQNTSGGDFDGFIARINNDGSGGYKASYVGGSGTDILVSVRPIVVNNRALLLSFGTTTSSDLPVVNYNSGTFYSSSNSGGYEIMFLICDMNLTSKYYLSYIGGTGNDYLGATGVPVGSNHLFYNSVDSVLYVGTTTHSYDSTQNPKFVGRGISDIANFGVPVFDQVKNNSNNDTHVIFAISTATVYSLLAAKWGHFEIKLNSSCETDLSWSVVGENPGTIYFVERSADSRTFESIGEVVSGSQPYSFTDIAASGLSGTLYYRIRSVDPNGQTGYSKIITAQLCNSKQDNIRIYPTLANNFVTIQGLNFISPKNAVIRLYDAVGNVLMQKRTLLANGTTQFTFDHIYPSGNYIISVKELTSGEQLKLQKIIIRH